MSKIFVDEMQGNTSTTISIPSGQTLNVAGNLSSTAGSISGTPSFPDGAKVNTIKHTGGTTAMTIDSTGRILTPARPSFHVATGTTQDAGTVVNWDTEIFDIGGNFNISTNLFTAPIAGVYCFNCTALQAGNGAQMTISIRKNAHNNGRFIARTDGDSGEHHGCSVTALFNLAATDTVEVYLHLGRIYGDTQFTNFTGFLLG